ncbi:uncharacterized protein B0I36DRAFT_363999 [Microdochium trichocladiopsis]|uniref:Uncharacterized protein n=1 Tax=Microdochium trichocladiopsis TaxID=1682393 RepID=A0A9P8Y5L2_9PEZI|nr:uncharacterized protein B0I36DRAFT_363999 [Microdochium trichocladiopsis]KAH7029460.1 hypothetical protein B0I36DRAFT_363999 [Microdochium trichocladiopsis]
MPYQGRSLSTMTNSSSVPTPTTTSSYPSAFFHVAADIRYCHEDPTFDTASIWTLLPLLASFIPPDHPFQLSLISAIHHLRASGGPPASPGAPSRNGTGWKDLPYLDLGIRERWDNAYIGNIRGCSH